MNPFSRKTLSPGDTPKPSITWEKSKHDGDGNCNSDCDSDGNSDGDSDGDSDDDLHVDYMWPLFSDLC